MSFMKESFGFDVKAGLETISKSHCAISTPITELSVELQLQ